MTVLGLLLVVVGAAIAASEAHNPTHGVAGGIGVLTTAVGVMLALSGLGAGLVAGLIGAAALAAVGGGAVTFVVREGLSTRRRRVRTGAEGLMGQMGVVRNWNGTTGSVSLRGAVWQARRSATMDGTSVPELQTGDRVVVESLTGLTLSVRLAEEWELI